MPVGMERSDTGPHARYTYLKVWLLFVLMAVFPLFMHLDALPLRVWDEARQAISAWEMWQSRDFLVTHFEGEPDMWSTKPPLLIWLQVAFISLLGPGELAIRLPSAIAALFTGWFILRLCIRHLDAPWMGLVICAILYTNVGYVNVHVSRSGDYDALLILWMITSLCALFSWSQKGDPRHLFWSIVLLALGVLTKSVQALIIVPGMVLYLLYRRQLMTALKQRMFWIGSAVFVLLVGGFYLGREAANPGYLQAVWENDMGGRYGTSLSGHEQPWDFYIRLLIDVHFSPWWLLALIGPVLGFASRDERLRHWTVLLTVTAATYLYFISSAETKLSWYAAPLIPLLAGLAAIPIQLLFIWASREEWTTPYLRWRVLPYVFLFVLFLQPYASMVGQLYHQREGEHEVAFYALSHHLQDASRGREPLEADVLCHEQYAAHLLFYVHLLVRQGHDIRRVALEHLEPGMVVLTSEGFVQEDIERRFLFDVEHGEEGTRTYRLRDVRWEEEGA